MNEPYRIVKVHISEIKAGDTIMFNGKQSTVCKNNIKKADFLPMSIFGDSFRSGTILVEKVLFPRWRNLTELTYE